MPEEATFSDQSDGGNEEVEADDDDDVVRSDDLGEEEEDDFVFVPQKKRRSESGAKKRSSKPKRPRLSGRNFMDVEAAVGDDDDDDEDDYNEDDDGEFIREADEAQLAERELDLAQRRRLYRSFDASEGTRGAAGHLASAIGNIERRYQEQRYTEEDDALVPDDEEQLAYGDYEGRGEDPTRFLADVKDSKLWVIRTAKSVPEREVVISIMNKFVHMSKEGKPFPVLSAFAPDGIRGYIYVEADNPGQVREALRGFRNVFLNHMKMVAVKEMSSVYTMGERDTKPLTRHELVRIKGGLYAGDLAQVTDLDEHNSSAWIRLVPRINLANYFEQKKKNHTGEPMRRPVARLLTREEIEAKGGEVESGMMRSTFRFDGKLFEETGYLLRKIRPHYLITGPDVNATLQELKEFGRAAAAEAGESGESGGAAWQKLLSALPAARRGAYALGDAVIVNAGDLAGLRGTVVSVEERAIGVQPLDKTLHNVVSVAPNDVVKYFEIGDSVKAVSGVHSGISGLVTSVDLKTKAATVFAPALGRPITCVLDHLQTCPNCGVETVSSLGGFNVADLVQSSEQVTGVIIRIDPGGALSVLTTEGRVEHVPLSGVATKRSNDFALALDRNNVQFGVRAAVTDARGVAGRVAHIWKRHVFVRLASKEAGHNGFMVCDSKELKVSAADGAPVGSSALVGGPSGSRPGFMSATGSRGGHPSSFGGQRGGGFRGGRGGGRQWVGQRVRVISGRNKGSFGEILSCESGGRLRIRLSQNDHTICLGKDELIILGQNSASGGSSFRSSTPRSYSNQSGQRGSPWDSGPPTSGPHESGVSFSNSRRRVDTPAPESHDASAVDPITSIWDSPTEAEPSTTEGNSATDAAHNQRKANLPTRTPSESVGTTNQASSSWTAYFQSVRERPEVS